MKRIFSHGSLLSKITPLKIFSDKDHGFQASTIVVIKTFTREIKKVLENGHGRGLINLITISFSVSILMLGSGCDFSKGVKDDAGSDPIVSNPESLPKVKIVNIKDVSAKVIFKGHNKGKTEIKELGFDYNEIQAQKIIDSNTDQYNSFDQLLSSPLRNNLVAIQEVYFSSQQSVINSPSAEMFNSYIIGDWYYPDTLMYGSAIKHYFEKGYNLEYGKLQYNLRLNVSNIPNNAILTSISTQLYFLNKTTNQLEVISGTQNVHEYSEEGLPNSNSSVGAETEVSALFTEIDPVFVTKNLISGNKLVLGISNISYILNGKQINSSDLKIANDQNFAKLYISYPGSTKVKYIAPGTKLNEILKEYFDDIILSEDGNVISASPCDSSDELTSDMDSFLSIKYSGDNSESSTWSLIGPKDVFTPVRQGQTIILIFSSAKELRASKLQRSLVMDGAILSAKQAAIGGYEYQIDTDLTAGDVIEIHVSSKSERLVTSQSKRKVDGLEVKSDPYGSYEKYSRKVTVLESAGYETVDNFINTIDDINIYLRVGVNTYSVKDLGQQTIIYGKTSEYDGSTVGRITGVLRIKISPELAASGDIFYVLPEKISEEKVELGIVNFSLAPMSSFRCQPVYPLYYNRKCKRYLPLFDETNYFVDIFTEKYSNQ